MTEYELIDATERPVLESSEPHVAITLVLDISLSMQGEKINSLNSAINKMISEMKNDNKLKKIVDLSIFVFGEKGRECLFENFRAISDCEPISLQASDRQTWVVDALTMSITSLKKRTELYDKCGGAYKPWLILVTDGEFFDNDSELNKVAETMKDRESHNKLHFMGLGVSGLNSNYDRVQLEKFAVNKNRIIDVKAANFDEFFSWVGQSMATISETAVGTAVQLQPLVFTV